MSMIQPLHKQTEIDIAFILEGSYPYTVGGVSAWVHQIIQAFPHYRFAVIFLGSRPEDYQDGIRYQLPKNVVHFETHYLFAEDQGITVSKCHQINARVQSSLQSFYLLDDMIQNKEILKFQELRDLNFYIDCSSKTFDDSFKTKKMWQLIVNNYARYCTDPSFVDYFWTILNLQKPLWKLSNIAKNFMPVRLLHTVSTGYAGLLGALLHRQYHFPLMLTEHGIYTQERRIELLQTKIDSDSDLTQLFATEMSYVRNLWMRYFGLLSCICYEVSDPILSLFAGAQEKQIEEGADKTHTQVIPNGVDIEYFASLRKQREKKSKPILCLLSRVVPIKDIKTFIRAMNIIVMHIPDAEGWIVGPIDENPQYYKECHHLISVFNLKRNIQFIPGNHDVTKIYPKIALLVLSSVSEGMPLVMLEAFASGVPAVTTAVGSCEDLIYGYDEEDKKLGAAGRTVQLSNPQALADAALSLLQHPDKWKEAQRSAIARVERYYDQRLLFKKYAAIYEQKMQ